MLSVCEKIPLIAFSQGASSNTEHNARTPDKSDEATSAYTSPLWWRFYWIIHKNFKQN